MGYPTKVQLIQRQASQQWYVAVPAALARSLELSKGELVEWSIQDKHALVLRRMAGEPAAEGKKKRRRS
jgi:antitoxin component of MazEF toxin-antitoxin module